MSFLLSRSFYVPCMLCTTYCNSSLPYRPVYCNLHILNVSLVRISNPYPFSTFLFPCRLSPPSLISMITSLFSPVPASTRLMKAACFLSTLA